MNIIGHQKIQNQLDKAVGKDNVFHAYLFVGPESVGKFTLAREFSRKLLENDNLELCPDYILVEPESACLTARFVETVAKRSGREEEKGKKRIKDISVEKLRDIQHRLNISPTGKFKVAIINDADRLTIAAQNSLLKILEEPPAGVIIILVTHDKDKLLTTILSRCQIKKFGLLSNRELEQMIADDFSDKEKLIFWANGRPGLLRKMIDDPQEVEFRNESIKLLQNLIDQPTHQKFELAEQLSKDASMAEKHMNLWIMYLRQCLLGTKGYQFISQGRALLLVAKIAGALKILRETNANARLVLENLFLSF